MSNISVSMKVERRFMTGVIPVFYYCATFLFLLSRNIFSSFETFSLFFLSQKYFFLSSFSHILFPYPQKNFAIFIFPSINVLFILFLVFFLSLSLSLPHPLPFFLSFKHSLVLILSPAFHPFLFRWVYPHLFLLSLHLFAISLIFRRGETCNIYAFKIFSFCSDQVKHFFLFSLSSFLTPNLFSLLVSFISAFSSGFYLLFLPSNILCILLCILHSSSSRSLPPSSSSPDHVSGSVLIQPIFLLSSCFFLSLSYPFLSISSLLSLFSSLLFYFLSFPPLIFLFLLSESKFIGFTRRCSRKFSLTWPSTWSTKKGFSSWRWKYSYRYWWCRFKWSVPFFLLSSLISFLLSFFLPIFYSFSQFFLCLCEKE